MDKKVIVVLELDAIMEAVRIMTDNDRDKALEFMKKYIEPAIRNLEHGHCQPIFEWQGKEPDMLKQLKGANHK